MGAALCPCEEPAPSQAPAEDVLPEEYPEERFQDRWITTKGNVHLIGLEGIHWSDGICTSMLKKRGKNGQTTIVTARDGATFFAQLSSENTLQWSDGDVWTRIPDWKPTTGSYNEGVIAYNYISDMVTSPGGIGEVAACVSPFANNLPVPSQAPSTRVPSSASPVSDRGGAAVGVAGGFRGPAALEAAPPYTPAPRPKRRVAPKDQPFPALMAAQPPLPGRA